MSLTHEVPAASRLITQLSALSDEAQRTGLLTRLPGGLNDLDTLVRLQTRTLSVQRASLHVSTRTRELTAQNIATARRTLAAAVQVLTIARQTLVHAANIDRKTGPVPPALPSVP